MVIRFILAVLLATPVAADVLVLQPDRDNTLFESLTGTLSSASGPNIFAGRTSTGAIRRAMLHFDLLRTSLLFALIQCSVYLASAIYVRRKLPAYYPWWRGGRPRTGLKDLGRSMFLTASSW
jgi:hypothetical protein